MSVKIIPCTCKSEFQDKEYGKGRRVGNKTKKTAGTAPLFRCTVCKAEHQ